MMPQTDFLPLARYMADTMDDLYPKASNGMHPMLWEFRHPSYEPHPPGVSSSLSCLVC